MTNIQEDSWQSEETSDDDMIQDEKKPCDDDTVRE